MNVINYENVSPNTIYIDSKEKNGNNRSERFIEFINQNSNKKYSIVSDKNLEYGDYIFENVIVEFKELDDFKTCMHSGRLTSPLLHVNYAFTNGNREDIVEIIYKIYDDISLLLAFDYLL